AARRDCEITGIDYVPGLIERAKLRAAAEGMDIDFRVGDAQALPFPDMNFDVVLSVFGVMFAPDQEKAASELLRVCRPGGTIGLASWMPEAFGRDFFEAHARYVPPPPGAKPPVRWGTETGLEELFGNGTSSIKSERRSVFGYYRSIEHAVELHCNYFGPTVRALTAVDAEAQKHLRKDIEEVFQRYNRAMDGTAMLEYQYLQTIATRA
ncbi:MAG: class I SAM-dependent methyltransferase, partial [Dehalococcoidia bacterium]